MKVLFNYAATTRGVTVRVAPSFLPDQSDPAAGRWVWAYHIRIENESDETVQLISRHWIITDGRGRVEEIEGPGVVGEQPVIESGRSFDYVSGCPLSTPSGIMRGTYQMLDADRRPFDIAIPPFSLDSPQGSARLN
ncbi:MAG: Co2+/Mg2+ efflux protein ApaG [Sphingomonadaceae bacterium]|nr:Co2+/Mg2+ efflux protein ApaG [Sphingomonadaceae bacterium]